MYYLVVKAAYEKAISVAKRTGSIKQLMKSGIAISDCKTSERGVKMKKLISLVLCFMLLFTMSQQVFSDSGTVTWTGAVNNSWHEPGNWSPQRVPGPGDTAVIPDGALLTASLQKATSLLLICFLFTVSCAK